MIVQVGEKDEQQLDGRVREVVLAILQSGFVPEERQDACQAIVECILMDNINALGQQQLRDCAKKVWQDGLLDSTNVAKKNAWVYAAASLGDQDMVDFLLSLGAFADEALFAAGLHEQLELAEWLIDERGADACAMLEDEKVITCDCDAFIEMLLSKGGDPNGGLSTWVASGKVDLVKLAVQSEKVDTDNIVNVLSNAITDLEEDDPKIDQIDRAIELLLECIFDVDLECFQREENGGLLSKCLSWASDAGKDKMVAFLKELSKH
jgi:hypothetical protein